MTQDKTYPKLCSDCRYSIKNKWNDNYCQNPKVIGNNAVALSGNSVSIDTGASCLGERLGSWFAKCGRKGKLFEMKREVAQTELNKRASRILDSMAVGGDNTSPNATKKVDQEIIQMRWLTQSGSTEQPRLQIRTVKNYLEMGLHLPIWTEWEDVQTYIKMDPVTSGSGGGSIKFIYSEGAISGDTEKNTDKP